MCNVLVCLVGDVWRVLAVGPLNSALGEPGAKQMPPVYTKLQRIGRPRSESREAPRALIEQNKGSSHRKFSGCH
jgi:hypothetical protein